MSRHTLFHINCPGCAAVNKAQMEELIRLRASHDEMAAALESIALKLDSLFFDEDLTDEKLRFWAEKQGPVWVDAVRAALLKAKS